MTRLLLWLYRRIQRILVNRGALPAWDVGVQRAVAGLIVDDGPDDDAEGDAPLPPEILDALKTAYTPGPPPAPAATAFPDTPNNERYVVWTRGSIDMITDDGREAARAWERVTKRAGVHRFWDREHHSGVPRGLRTELCIPLSE